MWEFECDCGNRVARDFTSVRNAKHANCGCTPLKWEKIGRTPLPYGRASLNHLYATYRRGAIKRGLSFDLTIEEFEEITSKNCHYCGLPPSRTHLATRAINGHYVYTGLDRVDNKVGYTASNLLPCCKVCNYAKRNASFEEFTAWLDRVRRVGAHGER